MTLDARLPDPGQRVLVDVPRAVRGERQLGSYRLTFRDDVKIRLEAEGDGFALPVGIPVVITWGAGRRQLVGTVVGVPEPGILHVVLDAPPQARRFQRYRIQLPGTIELFQTPEVPALHCIVVDLSQGGLRASVGTRLDSEAQVFVAFDVPPHGIVLAVAEVLDCTIPPHENVYQARLRFSHISDGNARRIAEFLGDLDR